MDGREVKKRIRRLEKELASYEQQEERLIKRRMELNCMRSTESAKMRNRLETKGVQDHISELRLRLWGLRQLNLPG